MTLLAPLLLLVAARAQDSGEEEEPDEVVIVESRRSTESPGDRSVTAQDARLEGADSLATALEQDVAVWGSSGGRGERLLTVRGFRQDQVAVFLDGIPTTVPYNGSLDLGKYASSFLDEARVVPGASAGIYGPVGLGGAVDIHTPPAPARPLSRATVRGALHGAVEASGMAGGPAGRSRLLLAGGGAATPGFPLSASFAPMDREDGGLRDASDERSQDLLGKAQVDLGEGGRLTSTAHFTTGEWGVPTDLYDTAPRYWRFTTFQDLGAAVSHSVRAGERATFQESVFTTWNRNILDSYDDATRTTQLLDGTWHSLYRDQQVGGTARADALLGPPRSPWGLARGRLFVNHQVHHSVPDVGEDPVDVSTTLASAALSAESLVEGLPAVFAGVEVDAEVPGQDTDFAPAPLFAGPVAGIRWEGQDRLSLQASGARRARFPTLKERFSSARGYREPNLDLGPETAWHVGLEAAARPIPPLRLSASAYDAEVDDLIDDVLLESGETQLQNVGRARFLGAEAVARWVPGEWLELEGAGARVHARLKDVDPPDDRVEDLPAWQIRGSALVRPGRWEIYGAWSGTGPQSFYNDTRAQWWTLGSFSRVDGSVSWQPVPPRSGGQGAASRLTLQVRNVLDASYQPRYGYPDPGRQVWLTLDVER